MIIDTLVGHLPGWGFPPKSSIPEQVLNMSVKHLAAFPSKGLRG